MKTDKMVTATIVSSGLLLLLIAWAFYQTLRINPEPTTEVEDYPQKAVMAQVESMNKARLEVIARNGQVVKGMNMEHVRLALGEPQRVEHLETDGESLTIWWYQNEGWKNIVFDLNNKVREVNKEP